tara:strand:- start:2490 stop:3494 length:1005 start_codon:yes stop_codon:yes gene_type:complete
MKAPFLYVTIVLSILFSGCKQSSTDQLKPAKSRSILPPNTGNISELVVVIPDNLWEGNPGQELKSIFQAHVLGIPQQEALFDVFAIKPAQFSSIFKTHKNILWLSIGAANAVNKTDEKWAKDQLVVSISSSSEQELAKLIRSKGLEVREWFVAKDLDRRLQILNKSAEKEIQKEIFEAYNFNMLVPNDSKVIVSEQDFVWLRRDQPKVNVISNLWVHSFPYKNVAQLSKSYIIQLRDSLGREHVEGARPQSYMTTEMLYEPDFTVKSQNPYTIEMRGLWTMVNDFLGGSFISHALLDEKNQSIVYVEGFLYCPKERKRYHLQELEAVLSSFTLE